MEFVYRLLIPPQTRVTFRQSFETRKAGGLCGARLVFRKGPLELPGGK